MRTSQITTSTKWEKWGEFYDVKQVFQLLDGTLRRRKQRKVIRFCRFDYRKDPANFLRERLMLCVPWRNEAAEFEHVDPNLEHIYKDKHQIIEANSKHYIKIDIDLISLIKDIKKSKSLGRVGRR
jgi:hypothetical protein